MSRYTREYGRTSSWYNKEWAPPTKQNARNNYSGWSKRGTRGNPAEYEGTYNQWEEGKPSDSAKDNEGEAIEGPDKSQGCDGTEDVEDKASESAPADPTDVETIRSKLWEQHRLLNNREGRVSATYKKNANSRGYDLNQKTMHALDTMAEEYLIFEETMKKVTLETEEGRHAVRSGLAQKDQDRLQDELESPPPRSSRTVGPCTTQHALMLTTRVQN